MKSLILIASSIIIFTSTIFSQNDSILSFSLKEIQDYAMEYSLNTNNTRLDIDISKNRMRETLQIGLPNVGSSFSYRNMIQQPVTLIPANLLDPSAPENKYVEMTFGTQHNATYDITGTQLIYSGAYFIGLQASKIYLKLSKENFLKEKQNVIETVTQTYYLILISENNKKILQENLDNLKKTLYETEEMFKSGLVNKQDIKQLKLNAETLKNSIIANERQIEVSYKLMKYQIGFNAEKEINLTDNLEDILKELKIDISLAQEFNLNTSINYKMLITQEQLSLLNMKMEKAKLLPSISAFATHQQTAMRDEFNILSAGEKWYPMSLIGFSIKLPIYDMTIKRAKVHQAKLELEKTKNIKSNSILGLELEAEQVKSDLLTAYEKYNSEKNNVELSREIHEDILISYREGMVSSMELTQAHNQYLTSQTNYFLSIYQLLNTKNIFDKVMNNY